MVICPKCKNQFSEVNEGLCHKCKGKKFVIVEKKIGPLLKQQIVQKEVICPRCNATGKELSNTNRNNRVRGAVNEYRVRDILEDWWKAPDGTKVEFRKTPQSGGSKLADVFDLAGDVACTDKTFPFHVEAKHTDQWNLEHLIIRPTEIYGDIAKYMKQCVNDAPSHRIPMLWLQRFGPSQPIFVMLIQNAVGNHTLGGIDNIWTGYTNLFGFAGGLYRYYIMGIDTLTNMEPLFWRSAIHDMLFDFQGHKI